MFSSLGWLLLVAAAAVHLLIATRSRRVGLLAAITASLLYAPAALGRGETASVVALTVVAFGCVVLAQLHVQKRTLHRERALSMLSDFDETTGCLNRRGFSRRMDDIVRTAVAERSELSLLALDLDHFKQVNDRHGHLVGDEVLYEVGMTMLNVVGERGVVARMGGEEFAVLVPHADPETAGALAERMLHALRKHRFAVLPEGMRLTMSAGIASERMTRDGVALALRARSDEALYAAKRSGRDRALLWAPGVHSNATPAQSVSVINRRLHARTPYLSLEMPAL